MALDANSWHRRRRTSAHLPESLRLQGRRHVTDRSPAQLSTLSDGTRRALELRVVDELPYAQVAQRLKVSEPTARARVSRGLRALGEILDPIIVSEATRA